MKFQINLCNLRELVRESTEKELKHANLLVSLSEKFVEATR